MNTSSLRRIEEVILPSGVWSFLEISQDTIYLDFKNVELGDPRVENELSMAVRLADNSFIMFLFNNIWDVEFLSHFDRNNIRMDEPLDFKINNIKFLNFEYLDEVLSKFNRNRIITQVKDFDITNIRNDFFLVFEIDDVAIVAGGDSLDFYSKSERIDEYLLKELCNQWMIYFLDYQSERKLINKDSMCEIHLKGDKFD